MKKIAEDIRGLFDSSTPQERLFYRNAPSLSSVEKEINNFEKFSKDGIIVGRRMGMGQVGMFDEDVAGYHSFVIMENASATPYERKHMDMGTGLNYIYSKKIFVHPDFRNQGIGSGLIEDVLDLSKKIKKDCIIDVDVANFDMINILSQYEFDLDFNWSAPRRVKMNRYYRDHKCSI